MKGEEKNKAIDHGVGSRILFGSLFIPHILNKISLCFKLELK